MFKLRPVLCFVVSTLLFAEMSQAARGRPWHKRRADDVEMQHCTAHKNTPPSLWPEEPQSPGEVRSEIFARALERLCQDEPEQRAAKFAHVLLREAKRFEVDPFLIAALVHDQSRCRPRTPKRAAGFGRFGLTRIPVEMHRPHVKSGSYRYYVRQESEWKPHSQQMEQYPFNRLKANKLEPNLYFAAALLKVFQHQADSLDDAFPSVHHRHPISHWFYGDRVRHVEPENRVLTARRRMIEYYLSRESKVIGSYRGMPIVSPLDGAPRLVIDYFGNRRGAKTGRGHRGIDIDGVRGEPVRAIADGRVVFAGIDFDGSQASLQATPEEVQEFPRDEMGPGGIYVGINHGDDFGTIYMHLDSMTVGYGAKVRAGDIIGTLGRSGTETSAPHLHLEMRQNFDRVDPAEVLSSVLVNPYRKKASRRKRKR